MAVSNSHITILTLNVNGLNASIKRHRLANWIQHTDGFWIFIQFASLCLLIGAFSSFTFRVNIVMCGFKTAILMQAGCFACYLMQILYYVDAF